MRRISLTNHSQRELIAQAVKTLKSGGTVAYPTETAYGLGADFLNPKGVKKVYAIKGRNFKKPLSVLVGSLGMAKKLVRFDPLSLSLAKKHWPGPLTLVLPGLNRKGTLALRLSSDRLATALVRQLGRPITSTSANLSGEFENYSAEEVVKVFLGRKNRPDLILDFGRLPKRKVSTVVEVKEGKIKVLRRGKISIR